MTSSPNPFLSSSDISGIKTSTTTATSISTAMATSPPPLSPHSSTPTTAATNITANSTTGPTPLLSSGTTASSGGTAGGSSGGFVFPATYHFPPFFSVQPNAATRHSQLRKWSALIQAWCRHYRIFRLSIVDAVNSPLFHNTTLRKRVGLSEARAIIDWMARSEEEGGGGRRAEWLPVGTPGASNVASISGFEGVSSLMSGMTGGGTAVVSTAKTVAWIWWRRPEEWATLIADWVDETSQKNTVLTLYELMHGEATASQEFHAMDPDVMLKSLNVLVKRGKAQVFGSEDQQGVKFF